MNSSQSIKFIFKMPEEQTWIIIPRNSSSLFTLKYMLEASLGPFRQTFNLQTTSGFFDSVWDSMKTSRSIFLSCKNAARTSVPLHFYPLDSIIEEANRRDSLLQEGESTCNKSTFSNPLATSLDLTKFFPSAYTFVKTHFTDIHFWPLQGTSL